MHPVSASESVGHYVLTPITKPSDEGQFSASVSIRRGMYDRIFRFLPRFPCDASAVRYALSQGRMLVLTKQLG